MFVVTNGAVHLIIIFRQIISAYCHIHKSTYVNSGTSLLRQISEATRSKTLRFVVTLQHMSKIKQSAKLVSVFMRKLIQEIEGT
jgi:hypothetical protein